MAPEALAQVLRPLKSVLKNNGHPNLIVGLDAADDAAVYKLNDDQAIINTLDFFTPVVDDPYDFGAIAAANSMSDVYAMGGQVIYALNIGAFPGSMEPSIISKILQGGAEKVREAGAVIAGGHTINDDEPKYGLVVTGIIHPNRIFTKGGAKAGEVLVLSKPLGTGTISTALKQGVANEEHIVPMVDSMKRLNRQTAQAAQMIGGVTGATDITGFGLLGHGMEMAQASGRKLVIEFNQVPLLPGTLQYAAAFIFPGGSINNKLHFEPQVSFAPSLADEQQMILWDAQTSGGLLLAIPAERVDDFMAAASELEQPAWVIGHVADGNGIEVLP
jgi:selenide,water dikinase